MSLETAMRRTATTLRAITITQGADAYPTATWLPVLRDIACAEVDLSEDERQAHGATAAVSMRKFLFRGERDIHAKDRLRLSDTELYEVLSVLVKKIGSRAHHTAVVAKRSVVT